MSHRAVPLLAFVLVTACARQPSPSLREPDGGVTVDTQVMAYLSMARAMHHEANLKEEDDIPGAISALDRLTAASTPHPGQRVPEIEEVLADTFARKAELDVRAGDLAKAGAAVQEGLTHAPTPSYFRGHLLEVGGITEEARAAALRDAGKPGEAAAAKARALELLHQAALVQEGVVRDSLSVDAKSAGGGP